MDEQTTYSATYCHLLVRFQGKVHQLIWYTFYEGPAKDGVWVEDGSVLAFQLFEHLEQFAHQQSISLTNEADEVLDLDTIAVWLTKPDPESVDCATFLTAWNLFTDMTHSLNMPFRDRDPKANKVYDKLFWGNNLPAVTPEGEHYDPIWTPSDITRMRQVMQRGLDIFKTRTGWWQRRQDASAIADRRRSVRKPPCRPPATIPARPRHRVVPCA